MFDSLTGDSFCYLLYSSTFMISPLLLLGVYTMMGVIGAFFSTRKKHVSWWWAIMFAIPLLVLSAITLSKNPLKYIVLIMNVNWAIASFITLGLMIFFLTRPGVLKGITLNSLLASSVRPFEGWLGISHEEKMLGLVGTRPTGLARYSAISSLVMLCLFVTYNTWYSFFAFLAFMLILLFSKGKMEMLSFIIAMGFLLFVSHSLLTPLTLIYLFFIIISGIIVFGNVPYIIKENVKEKFSSETVTDTVAGQNVVFLPEKQSVERIMTLSGRVGGVWRDAVGFIKKRPLFGYGFAAERYLLKDYLGRPTSVDSNILNAILQSGFLGGTFFLLSIGSVILMGYQLLLINHSLMLLEATSVGIFILLRGITQSFSNYGADWMFLSPLIAYIQILFSSYK